MTAFSFFSFHSTICENENYRVKFKSNVKQKWKEKLNLNSLEATELVVHIYRMFVLSIHSKVWFTSKVELVRNQGVVNRRNGYGLRILCIRWLADYQMSEDATGCAWLRISTSRICLIYTHSILSEIIPFTVFLPAYFQSLFSSTF